MRDRSRSSSALQRVLLFTTLAVLFSSLSVAAAEKRRFDIAAGEASRTLNEFSRQAELQIYFDVDAVRNFTTRAVAGKFEAAEALSRMLGGTGLGFEFVNERTVAIVLEGDIQTRSSLATAIAYATSDADPFDQFASAHAASTSNGPDHSSNEGNAQAARSAEMRTESASVRSEREADVRSMPEVLVKGSRILNADIKRTRDDAQPYVVYDRTAIERSGAVNINDFLKQRLPMNTIATSPNQLASAIGGASQINLRGLGANQTLVLIDGRRAVGINTSGSPSQADLNGIPLAAVERIEVLPTTASGIYGGSATGGVVNVVLRRDYQGVDFKISYDNTFDTDSARRQVDVAAGLNLEGGKTNVLLAGSYSDQNVLAVRDRDFFERGRAALLANNGNNPQALNVAGIIPPLGRTSNVRSLNGSPLFGPGTSSITSVPIGYAGGGGIEPLRANAGSYNLDFAESAQQGAGGSQALLNGPTVESLAATIRRQFGDRFHAFLELGTSTNEGEFPNSLANGSFLVPASASYNPFGQSIVVTVPIASLDTAVRSEVKNERAAGGVIVALPGEWSAAADYTWARSRLEFAFAAGLTAGAQSAVATTLDVLRDTNAFPVDFSPFAAPPGSGRFDATLENAALRLSGPVGDLPAGRPIVSALLEYRDEVFDDGVQLIPNFDILIPSRSQSVASAYLEVKLPLVSPRNALTGLRELELQLAARRDDYSVEGSTNFIRLGSTTPVERRTNERTSTNPTFGLRYQPSADAMFRASYGTGFLPPSVNQLLPSAPAQQAANAIDPRRGNTSTGPVQGVGGGNPDLRPEESESVSFGVVLTPRFFTGMRLSVDYTKIDKTDNIATLSVQQILDNETLFPERVTRAPVAPGDPFLVGAVTFVDTTSTNIARAEIEAYDVQFDFQKEVGRIGSFDFFTLATWQTHFSTQLVPTSPWVERVGVGVGLSASSFPLKFKANAGLTWNYRQWAIGWTGRYFDSYYVADPSSPTSAPIFVNQGSQRVPSQDYHDVFAKWATPSIFGSQLVSNIEVQLGVRNVFNARPPFDAANGLGLYSFFGDPRLASYYVSLKASF